MLDPRFTSPMEGPPKPPDYDEPDLSPEKLALSLDDAQAEAYGLAGETYSLLGNLPILAVVEGFTPEEAKKYREDVASALAQAEELAEALRHLDDLASSLALPD